MLSLQFEQLGVYRVKFRLQLPDKLKSLLDFREKDLVYIRRCKFSSYGKFIGTVLCLVDVATKPTKSLVKASVINLYLCQ